MKCKNCAHHTNGYCDNIESIYFDMKKEKLDGCTDWENKDDTTTILVLNGIIAVLVAAIGYLIFK